VLDSKRDMSDLNIGYKSKEDDTGIFSSRYKFGGLASKDTNNSKKKYILGLSGRFGSNMEA
jgi:hypothetical protein